MSSPKKIISPQKMASRKTIPSPERMPSPKKTLKIPDRVSSKKTKRDEPHEPHEPYEPYDAFSELEDKRKKLKPQGSFTSEYWDLAAKYTDQEVKLLELKAKESMDSFSSANKGNVDGWSKTKEAKNIFQKMRAEKVSGSLYRKQKERVKSETAEENTKFSYLEHFVSSRLGLDIKTSRWGNDKWQRDFRKDLKSCYEIDAEKETYWDPILHIESKLFYATASHIFARRWGQTSMDAIFGQTEKPELFSARNGFFLNRGVERLFDKGLFAIVPNIPEQASTEQIKKWRNDEVKNYKIRIIDFEHAQIDQSVSENLHPPLSWRDMDGRPLKFKNSFRPRARYLYFHFACQRIQYMWKKPHTGLPKIPEARPKGIYWGTRGSYIKRHMLEAFIAEIGDEYGDLMAAAKEEGEDDMPSEDDLLMAFLVAQNVSSSSMDTDIEDLIDVHQSDSDESDI
ncbi:MAG: hypothetical protein Q9227_008623 [Pyrenula ochraceoflavens]